MVASINGFIILCLIVTSAYFVGLLSFFADNEKDKCDMTYMFELPQYVRISNDYDKKFPKYGLYYYDEGPPHKNTPKFWGIPVLFIPGNAGSHKQVRSLASVALRTSVNKRLPYHFDYFTIDTNEELSGLSGIFLKDQLEYTNHSLHFILKLYKNQRFPPTSVVLIGHSMGGVIARKLAQMASSPIQIVITLASPHKRSPIILDEYISSFYEHVTDSIRPDITFVNLAGGHSDLLVPTTLTDSKDNSSLYAVTTHIPLSWAPSDHKQILWCKQTVLSLTRSLFDSVDPMNRQISDSSEYRKRIFEHHLLKHSGTKARFRERYFNRVDLEGNAEWIEQLPRQYSVRLLKGTKRLHWYMIRIINDPRHEKLTLVALNLGTVDWVYACQAYIPKKTYKICDNGIHLTHLSTIDPSARYKRRSLTISLHDIRRNYSDEFTHVIFKVAPTQDPVVFHVDVYNSKDRRFELKLPTWSEFRKTVIKETDEGAIRYEIDLPDLTHIIQSYYLYLNPLKCSKEAHHATATLVVPWSNENNHKHFTDVDKGPFHIRLYNLKPNGTKQSPFLRLTLDPTCRYEVKIQRSLEGTLNQLARYYSPFLIVNIATAVLLILKTQLQSLGNEKGCTSFFVALKTGTKPYYILGVSKLGTAMLSSSKFSKIVPLNLGYDLKEEGLDSYLLPYIMYLISIGIIWLFASVITVWITFCESTIHKFILKFLTRTVPFTIIWSEYMISALQKIPYVVSAAIIFISYNTCGALALALGTIFYFLKLTQMSQDYIEVTVFTLIKSFILKYRTKRSDKSNEETKGTTEEQINAGGDQCPNNDVVKDNQKTSIDSTNDDSEKQSDEIEEEATVEQIGESVSETEIIGHIGGDNKKTNEVNLSPPTAISFHGVMFLIWVLTTIINIPSVLTWARNYHFNASLEPDPSFLPGFLLSVCTLALWQIEMPNTKKMLYKEVSYLINAIAIIALIYAPIYIYRLNYLLSATVIIVVVHQIIAPVSSDSSNEVEDKDHIKYEDIKTKLE